MRRLNSELDSLAAITRLCNPRLLTRGIANGRKFLQDFRLVLQWYYITLA